MHDFNAAPYIKHFLPSHIDLLPLHDVDDLSLPKPHDHELAIHFLHSSRNKVLPFFYRGRPVSIGTLLDSVPLPSPGGQVVVITCFMSSKPDCLQQWQAAADKHRVIFYIPEGDKAKYRFQVFPHEAVPEAIRIFTDTFDFKCETNKYSWMRVSPTPLHDPVHVPKPEPVRVLVPEPFVRVPMPEPVRVPKPEPVTCCGKRARYKNRGVNDDNIFKCVVCKRKLSVPKLC